MKILPIFLPQKGCPFKCVYCNQNLITKAAETDLQHIQFLIDQFCQFNYSEDKEIAFYGGTFTNLEEKLIKKLFQIAEPHINANTGIRISTRPDFIFTGQLQKLKTRGLRTVELGIQSFSDKVLAASGRNYSKDTAQSACRIISSCNLALGIQLMPGLPGSDAASIKESITSVLVLKPEFVRIYPTVVLKNTALERWFNSGKYLPLSLEKAVEITAEMIEIFQKNKIKVIKSGLHSDIEKQNIIAGPYHESFGELVRMNLLFKKIIANYPKSKTFVISESDISLFRGFKQKLIKRLKAEYQMETIPVIVDPNISKGNISFTDQTPQQRW
ncbi:MAG: hypothetical protein APR54_06215 [Candidatus Cloacimonas sp. SDB]|nr:MAG: hypothetical protein APR54_06215 [Candidatus Cloacimonas sp. SDB]